MSFSKTRADSVPLHPSSKQPCRYQATMRPLRRWEPDNSELIIFRPGQRFAVLGRDSFDASKLKTYYSIPIIGASPHGTATKESLSNSPISDVKYPRYAPLNEGDPRSHDFAMYILKASITTALSIDVIWSGKRTKKRRKKWILNLIFSTSDGCKVVTQSQSNLPSYSGNGKIIYKSALII